MASIKDLKNNQNETIIDATGGSPVVSEDTSIDATKPNKGNSKTVVDLNGMFVQPKGRHTTIEPKSDNQKRVQNINQQRDDIEIDITSAGNNRVAADLSSLPDMTPEEAAYNKEHFVEDPMERMLSGEDSLLGKYLTNKEEELKVGYEAIAYNRKKAELEKEAEETGDDSALIDFLNDNSDVESIPDNNLSVDDDDILSSLDDDTNEEVEEEEIEVAENNVNQNIDELEEEFLDIEENTQDDEFETDDSLLDDEELYPEDQEDDSETTNEEVEEEEVPEEKEETEESYDKDMDVVYENDLEVNEVEEEIEEDDSADEEEVTVSNEDVPEPEPEETEVLARLKELATEKIKPISKKLDISSFTVIKKPVTNTKQFNVKPIKQAKWVLMNQETTVFMKEFTGAELERLREFTQESTGRNPSLQSLIKRYRMIYDHIIGAKPASFEQWMKSTPLTDEDNYFFAIYIASFKGANYIPKDCTNDKCNEMWLTDDVPIMDMVKFENDAAKAKFTKIYKEEYTGTSKAGLYISEIIPISDSIAIAFKEPSLYTRTEFMTLETDFREKYAAILDFIPYIDSIYYIDQNEGTLTPVGYKSYADNTLKTTKSKIQQFAKVLNTLSIDEFSVIRPYMNAVAERTSGLTYIVPETTCPKCGTVVPEAATTAEELLFTRYQLGALVNTSLN